MRFNEIRSEAKRPQRPPGACLHCGGRLLREEDEWLCIICSRRVPAESQSGRRWPIPLGSGQRVQPPSPEQDRQVDLRARRSKQYVA